MTTSYIDTILNLLYAGEKVRISFPTTSLRESFRKKLYAKKAIQDDALEALLDEESKTLRCDVTDIVIRSDKSQPFLLTCWLQPKMNHISFEVIKEEVLKEEQNENENILREDETLPANLASTPPKPKENS